jgi:hypothetical protein
VLALLLLLSVVAPIVIRSTSLIHFFANRDYIARELCRERDIKDSCCKGSCYLKERLNESSDGAKSTQSTREVRMTELPFLIQSVIIICDIFYSAPRKEVLHYSFAIKENKIAVNPKPPCNLKALTGII